MVAVPVFVTDKSGRAVSGLSDRDFELYDRGQRVPIVAFHAVDVDALAEAGSALDAEGASAGAMPFAVQAAAARHFLLLFDLQFSPPGGILRVRKAALRFLRESLSPGDLVAAATYVRHGLKMVAHQFHERPRLRRASHPGPGAHGFPRRGGRPAGPERRLRCRHFGQPTGGRLGSRGARWRARG